jgi:hypothetical protein
LRVWIPIQSSANAPGNSFISDLELHRAMVHLYFLENFIKNKLQKVA